MGHDLLDQAGSRRFRGNLHCHSNRSDGLRPPETVAAAYRDAGYDFIVLSDHFESRYGWQITDTRDLRDDRFTTILGAEFSSAAWDDRLCYWVTAAGIPFDFAPSPPGNHAETITRARDYGAFITMLHPGLNNLPLAASGTLPALDAIHSVEIYNHNMTVGAGADRANGAYFLDGLLEQGRNLLITAGDDAHFAHPSDRFGGWVDVLCDRLEPESLVAALKAGRYFSSQGPIFHALYLDGTRLHVRTSEVATIALTGGGDRWQTDTQTRAEPGATIAEADFDLTPFRGSYCRVIAIDPTGKRAWSNPIWP